MNLSIFHSVNSGLYLWDGNHGLLIDGIHDGIDQGLSPMPEALVNQLETHSGLFAHTDGILFTHLHSDHFLHSALTRLLDRSDNFSVYGPNLPENQARIRPIRPGLSQIRMSSAKILAQNTTHDAKQFQNTPHCSYLVQMGGDVIFIAGDAVLSPKDASDFSQFYPQEIDAAFCNVFQFISLSCLDFLRILQPKRLFLYHLPHKKDDRFMYHSLVKRAVQNHDGLPNVEQLQHMSWLDNNRPTWSNL